MTLTTRAAVLFAFAALPACVQHRGEEVKAAVKVMERERTPDKLFERGQAFAHVGDTTRAEQYLNAAIEAGGDEHVILPVLLRVLVEDKRYRAAIELCENYSRRHPADIPMQFVLASLQQAVGNVEAARSGFVRVLEAQPDNADAHYALGVLLRDDRGDLSGADLHFREYLRVQPRGEHGDEARGSLVHRLP